MNKKIFKNPNTGVRKVPKKEPTQPIEMKLETERRMPTRQNNSQEDSFKAYEFHAKPVPSAILKHPVVSGARLAHACCVRTYMVHCYLGSHRSPDVLEMIL